MPALSHIKGHTARGWESGPATLTLGLSFGMPLTAQLSCNVSCNLIVVIKDINLIYGMAINSG